MTLFRNTFFPGRWAEALVRVVDGVQRAESPWPWLAVLAAGAPWMRVEWGGWVIYPGHWAIAALLGVAFLREATEIRGDPLPLKGALLLCAYLSGMALLRGEGLAALGLLGATAANFAWGWAAYRLGRHGGHMEAAMEGLVLFVAAALVVELAAWTFSAAWPPPCLLLNCPPWPEDPPRFRGGFQAPGEFGLLIALAWPVLALPLVLARQMRPTRAERILVGALAAAIGMALLAGGGGWLVAAGALIWLGLYRALAPWGDPRDAALLKRMALWMAVVPVLFYARFPGYLGLWFSLERPPWGHVRIAPAGSTPRVLSSERTTLFVLEITNAGAFPLAQDAAIVPRLLITPERGKLRAHDLARTPLPRSLGSHETLRVDVPVRLPPWAEQGFLSWQVMHGADGRPAALSGNSTAGLRFVNADYRSLADPRENLLSALAARARAFHRETFVPESEGPVPASAEKVLGEILDTALFSPLWGEAKSHASREQPFPPDRPFLAHLFAGYGLIALVLWLRLGWVTARRAELLGLRTSKAAPRLAWPQVPVSLGIVGILALFSPALGTFHGQWGLFLLIGFVEGRYDRLVPPRPAARTPLREGLRALARELARALQWVRGRLPRPRRPRRAARRWPR
jgi:hypothetical protein